MRNDIHVLPEMSKLLIECTFDLHDLEPWLQHGHLEKPVSTLGNGGRFRSQVRANLRYGQDVLFSFAQFFHVAARIKIRVDLGFFTFLRDEVK